MAKIVYYFQKKRYEREPSLHHLEEVKKAKTDRSMVPSENKDHLAEHQYKMIKKSVALSRYFLQCNIENQLKASVFCYKKCK